MPAPRRNRLLPLILLALLVPIAAGLGQTLVSVFSDGATGRTAWAVLWSTPGLVSALRVTVVTGLAATALSLLLAVALCALLVSRFRGLHSSHWLAPFLATPHAALAIGLAFLLAPSGWLLRLLAPLLELDRPPDLALVNDAHGIALIIGLGIKETPFLLLMLLTALSQLAGNRQLAAARSLGYGLAAGWLTIVLPQLWPMIRLPVFVVLAYSLANVEMALILGPSNPPTLAVLLLRLFTDPDLTALPAASAGALLQLFLVGGGVLLISALRRLCAALGLAWIRSGRRGRRADQGLVAVAGLAVVLLLLGALALLALVLWSLAWRWSWPGLWPDAWSLRAWTAATSGWLPALGQTLLLAGASTAVALFLAVVWLESEDRCGHRRSARAWIHLPLLVPQIGFLAGLNTLFLSIGVGNGWLAVVWVHVLFVFPYVMIALVDAWQGLDPRLLKSAAALGAGPWKRLLRIKLPVLLSPMTTAAAIGIAVSVAQYLPTLFMGAGRISTLTTEAVALASGSDRRITAVYASLQAAVPLAGYLLALAVPLLVHRNRRGLLVVPR